MIERDQLMDNIYDLASIDIITNKKGMYSEFTKNFIQNNHYA
jgi:hypothetical protein